MDFKFGRKYKGFSKLINGKNFRRVFLHFYFLTIFLAKVGLMDMIAAEVQTAV
jgi:hypothetical protein